MDKNKYEQDYAEHESNAMFWLISGLVVVVIIAIVWWVVSANWQPTPPVTNTTNTTNTVNTTNIGTSTATTTQATSTTTKPPVKPLTTTQINAAWNTFKKDMACQSVTLPPDSTVLSFRGEGGPVKDNGAAAYKCKDGHTYIY